MARQIIRLVAAAAAVCVAACADPASPVSPGAASPGLEAAADGSTLKATAPLPVFPFSEVELDTREPTLIAENAVAVYTSTPEFEYRFEIRRSNGQVVINSPKLEAGLDGQTSWETPILLDLDTEYRWRARVEIGNFYGPWSTLVPFRTLAYQGLTPRPPGGNWPSNPLAIVAYIGSAFPERLAPVPSEHDREVNMAFMRDRIIEAGICGGLDLALNLKRGIGPHSIDALAWRQPDGDVEVVDFAVASTDHTSFVGLAWQIVEGPAGYDPYPNHPGC